MGGGGGGEYNKIKACTTSAFVLSKDFQHPKQIFKKFVCLVSIQILDNTNVYYN